jgi:4-hydroxy-tetrahydrodipicolinate synthase
MTGDYAAALEIQVVLMPLHDAMFCEPSPAPVKYAASLLGLCKAEVRLPLVEATGPAQERIRNAMAGAGLRI